MKTINTTLPVYDKIQKQIYEKADGAKKQFSAPTITPNFRLPSMLWNVEAENPGEIIEVELIEKDSDSGIDISSYFNTTGTYITTAGWQNGGYDAFNTVGKDITHALKTTAAGEATAINDFVWIGLVPTGITVGETIRIRAVFNWVSGSYPTIELRKSAAGATISNKVVLVNGLNYILLTATSTEDPFVICIYNLGGDVAHWDCTFTLGEKSVIPHLYAGYTDDYFQYKGETLGTLLPFGVYYLKFTTVASWNYVYYSDLFEVSCVYPDLITAWANVAGAGGYETFLPGTADHTEITSAIEGGAAGQANSTTFNLVNFEKVRAIFFLTLNGGGNQLPTLTLMNITYGGVEAHVCTTGLNDIEYTAGVNGTHYFIFTNTAPANWAASEVLIRREYSEKYVTIDYHNACNIGDLMYDDDITYTLWLETEPLEPAFPYTEKGQDNGKGEFTPTWQRQEKTWIMRTLQLPPYIIDVLHRLKLHDTVELTDLVGDVSIVKQIDTEQEWKEDDKYYATAVVTVDLGEEKVITGCCADFNDNCP